MRKFISQKQRKTRHFSGVVKVKIGLVHHSWGGAAVSRLVRSTSVQGSGFEPSPGALCFLGRDIEMSTIEFNPGSNPAIDKRLIQGE